MTPYSYFFQMGAGFVTGILIIGLPGLWFYRRFLGGGRS